jgi:hypothetical protein
MFGTFLLVIVALLLFVPPVRGRLLEGIKTFSDFLILDLLRRTSRFGSELTVDGKAEQRDWREQRLRNLRGLALRSKEAVSNQQSAKKSRENNSSF